MAKPMAIEVKLLLTEYMVCGMSGAYGSLQVSKATFLWRKIMMLCSSIWLRSKSSSSSDIAFEDTPTCSGKSALGSALLFVLAVGIKIHLL